KLKTPEIRARKCLITKKYFLRFGDFSNFFTASDRLHRTRSLTLTDPPKHRNAKYRQWLTPVVRVVPWSVVPWSTTGQYAPGRLTVRLQRQQSPMFTALRTTGRLKRTQAPQPVTP